MRLSSLGPCNQRGRSVWTASYADPTFARWISSLVSTLLRRWAASGDWPASVATDKLSTVTATVRIEAPVPAVRRNIPAGGAPRSPPSDAARSWNWPAALEETLRGLVELGAVRFSTGKLRSAGGLQRHDNHRLAVRRAEPVRGFERTQPAQLEDRHGRDVAEIFDVAHGHIEIGR